MSQDPVSEFLNSAHQSGLLSADEAATLSRDMRQCAAATRPDVAAKLVEMDLLTAYQAEQLLAGRGAECVLAGRYVIRQKLGAGAMGAVYLADDKKLDRAVAIKMLPAQSVTDAGAVARFQREAKALAKLSHPNIIQAYDSDQDAGRQFLVMEYAEGTNLSDVIRAKGRIAPALAADYIYQAALGLQNAHEKGLVHRDLKPGNLLLTTHGQLKILDLGLARFLQDQVGDATLTREGTGMGTPDYMPPEQFHDARHVDARSDIYSLGCTLYHLITGRVPFPGTSMSAKYSAHEQQEPPPLEEFCPDVPAGLALVVQRMMAKRPGDRFQSAREVAEAMFPHVAGSSHAILHIKGTATWQGSQLGLSVVPLRVRRRRQIIVGSAVTVAALAVVASAFWAGGAFGPQLTHNRGEQYPLGDVGPQQPDPAPGQSDSNVLTVAQDGTGQFRTISDALEKVTPGMTIRVLDSATYAERVHIRRATSQADIIVESPARATIAPPLENTDAISISSVPGVTVRGFRLRVAGQQSISVRLTGTSCGARLQELEMKSTTNSPYVGVHIYGLRLESGDPPVVIENCVIRRASFAVNVYALGRYDVAQPIRGVIIRNNTILTPGIGIAVIGAASHIHVVGNRVMGASHSGIQLEQLLEGAEDILIANNTLLDCAAAFRLWTDAQKGNTGRNIELANNLALGTSSPDMIYFDSGGDPSTTRGVGDGAALHQVWRMHHNWREFTQLDTEPLLQGGWIPLTENDVQQAEIDGLSRDPADERFLRPASDSPLATAGAGTTDESLPSYVGAVPPEGVDPWPWQKTWDERHLKRVKESLRLVEFPQQHTLIKQDGWETIVDASKEGMEKWLAERKAAMHSVVWLDSVLVGDRPLFAAIAAMDDRQTKWIALPDMPADNIGGGPIAQLVDFKTYRLVSLGGFSAGGTSRASTLWVPGVVNPGLYPNAAESHLDEVFAILRRDLKPLLLIRPYPVEGGGILTGLYAEQTLGQTSSNLKAVTASTLTDFVAARRDAGDLITSLAAYPKDGQLLYAVVAGSNPKKIEWQIEPNLTVDQFNSRNAELAEQGFRPSNVTACPWDGAVRYVVVWVKEPVAEK